MNKMELAWAAGFFDGEGSTTFSGKNYPRIEIGQKPRNNELVPEVLERFQKAMGMGNTRIERRKDGRVYFSIKIFGFEKCQAVIAFLWPWLSLVKRQQAIKILKLSRGR